jgi:hypothetical protein
MIYRFSNWIYKISNGWIALGAVLLFLLFSIFVLPSQSTKVDSISEQIGTPDLSFYYSKNDIYKMAEVYGEEGRALYIQARFTFDLIWPIVYTLFLTTCISWIFGQIIPLESKFGRVNLTPVMALIFDYLENISTSLIMFRYPQQTPGLDMLAPIFTMLKWILLIISFLLLIVGFIGLLWTRIQKRRAV